MTHGGNVWQGERPEDWLDHSANVRPGGAPAWVREALLSAMDKAEYYPQLSMTRARSALGEFLGLAPERVLPTAGGTSAIALAARLGCDRVRVPVPSFTEYAALSERIGLRVETVPLLEKDRSLRPPEALAEGMEENTCLWLCNPNNPVGPGFSPAEIAGLLREAERKNGWLAVDEAFIAYCPEYSAVPLLPGHERLVITGSLTKILGIPGVRLGYLCAGEALSRLAGYQNPWELSCFAEAVVLALPDHREDLAAEAERSRARRERLRAGLEALGVYVYPSDANFLLADFRRDTGPLEEYLYGKKILVRRCMDFALIDDGRHLRLAVKDGASNARLLDALKEAMACAGKV